MLSNITPIILTYNEAPNIERTLSALRWAKQIIVVDSYSDDATLKICEKFKNVEILKRKFDLFATQWNFAISQNVDSEWILALDADHLVSDPLLEELRNLKPNAETNGYWVSFIYKMNGRELRGSLYPPSISLYRKQHAHYNQDGHAMRVEVAGNLESLDSKIYHDDRKSKERWTNSQKKYALQEAEKLSNSQWSELKWPDRLRLLGVAPLIILPYTYIIRGLLFNGVPGWQYSWQRFLAEIYLQLARIK